MSSSGGDGKSVVGCSYSNVQTNRTRITYNTLYTKHQVWCHGNYIHGKHHLGLRAEIKKHGRGMEGSGQEINQVLVTYCMNSICFPQHAAGKTHKLWQRWCKNKAVKRFSTSKESGSHHAEFLIFIDLL